MVGEPIGRLETTSFPLNCLSRNPLRSRGRPFLRSHALQWYLLEYRPKINGESSVWYVFFSLQQQEHFLVHFNMDHVNVAALLWIQNRVVATKVLLATLDKSANQKLLPTPLQ